MNEKDQIARDETEQENDLGRHVEMWLAVGCAFGLFGIAMAWIKYGAP
jgi:hypothetical protein